MSHSSFAVSIEFNAATNEVSLWMPGRQLAGGWALADDECRELSPDELERQLGSSVLALISQMVGTSIGNRDYLADYKLHSLAMLDRLRQELAEGSEGAIIYIAQRLLSIARLYGDRSAVDQAEAELRAAAAAGNSRAVAYLADDWPQEKQAALDELRRGRE